MATTTENHINRELAERVGQDIAEISAALKASAERPSKKYFNAGLDFPAYVASTEGITFLLRFKLKRALRKNDNGAKLRKIIDETSEYHFLFGVREILSDYWDANFKK